MVAEGGAQLWCSRVTPILLSGWYGAPRGIAWHRAYHACHVESGAVVVVRGERHAHRKRRRECVGSEEGA